MYEIALSLHAFCESVASCVCQHVKEQTGPFKLVNVLGGVEATSGWSTWGCVMASLQVGVPSVSLFVGIFFCVLV